MPELPEVENVKLSLHRQGAIGQVFAKVQVQRQGLRTPFAKDLSRRLKGERILKLERRAKFLLFETEHYILLSHLGMTGSWRTDSGKKLKLTKHDHVVLHFTSQLQLIFNDPRRFGLLELVKKTELHTNKWLKHLGLEPLEDEFTPERLFIYTRRRKTSIKSLLMDQKVLVGVGNIYASEALYRAAIRPTRAAGKITRAEAAKLVLSIRQVLQRAILAGGSTISDYRNSEGKDGAFQNEFLVYDRSGKPCVHCGTKIRSNLIAGRNTFWCPKCQR